MKTTCTLALILLALLEPGCEVQPTAQKPMPQTNSTPVVAGWPPTKAQPKLQTTKLFIGREEITAELALTPIQVGTGMMFRTNMLENEGMLFVFSGPEPRSFYMKNTLVPLTLAYIDPDGTIVEFHDLQPLDESPVNSRSGQIQFVLEMKKGWFSRHNIATGTVMATELGSMRDSFHFAR